MKLAVVTTDKAGISTTLVGEQVIEGLRGLGHEVVPVYTDGRAGTPISTKSLSRLPTVCLLEHKTAAILAQVRYSRPACLLSVWTGNVEGYEVPDLLAYAAQFLKPRANGVPVRHVSHSLHTEAKLRELVQRFFRPSVGADILGNMTMHRYGVDPVFQPGENDPDLLVAPMNRVVQGSKNVGLHSEATGRYQLIARQRGFQPRTMFYHAPGFGPEDVKIKADLSVYEFQEQPADRADYVRNAARTGLFLSCSNFESFGIYYLELLCSGAVGVFLDRPWVRTLLPNYPYIVPVGELISCLLHVRESHAEVRQQILAEIVPGLRETYSIERFCRGLVAETEALLQAAG